MKHVAIDLGGRESQLCARAEDGTILNEGRVSTKSLPKLVKDWEPTRLILETSAEAFRVADAARACGHEVRVVPATLVKQLGVGSRGVKNDRRDAQILSQVSCRIDLPSVHIPSEASRQLKSLCGSREALLRSRRMLINNVRGWLRTQLALLRRCTPTSFPARVREHANTASLDVPPHMERQLLVIESINMQIKEADRQLQKIAGENEICRRFMTVPGVGPVTAVRFFAAIDKSSRFRNAHAVQSYIGLTPGENSSSERKQHTGITKAGSTELRCTLVQAAWCALRRPNEPMVLWANQIAARRGKFIAVVALARKIAGILYALWRDGTTYCSSRSSLPVAA
jgi:transposase